jgi:hypothetical protein
MIISIFAVLTCHWYEISGQTVTTIAGSGNGFGTYYNAVNGMGFVNAISFLIYLYLFILVHLLHYSELKALTQTHWDISALGKAV